MPQPFEGIAGKHACASLLAFRADDALSTRDKAIMELFYSSGLRLAELVWLDLTDSTSPTAR